jgi:NAD(P)-dependent dehydrogenase (short-subunit alcohol dehydrogenase family)
MSTSISRFDGKVAFVTGGGTGIGRATALRFAGEGADVVVVDLVDEANRETVQQIEATGRHGLAITCDVTDSDAVADALRRTVDTFGGLDIAFNNAGIEQPPTPVADLSEEMWDRVINVDLRSVFVCMRHEIPLLLERGGGAIVNTSSGAGIKGFAGGAGYGAAKHGVIGLTRCAALDYASSNIRINAICPGIIETDMMNRFTGGTDAGRARVIGQEPIGRMGHPVGHALVIDGGQTI